MNGLRENTIFQSGNDLYDNFFNCPAMIVPAILRRKTGLV